jgi:chromosome segregation ATPase
MQAIESPAGLRVLSSLIDLIDNKSAIKKVIAEIDDKIEEANAKIAVVGKISEIGKLRTQAQEAFSEAINTLDNAKSEAKSIVGKAKGKAGKETARQKHADQILAAADAREEKLTGREQSIGAREVELQRLMDQNRAAQKEARALKASAEELIASAEAKLAAFENFASKLQ